ncbi:MAG TPA: hypothetical protein VE665_05350, partial [Hyphomicrobiaceae bacterium]|nr:hypothetical protein [Hyphomicrobiaceae bacterium]
YFILHHVSQVAQAAGVSAWRQRLFAALERNFEGAQHDNIPPDRVFTVGIPLYLPSKVSQRHGLEIGAVGDRHDSKIGARGAA